MNDDSGQKPLPFIKMLLSAIFILPLFYCLVQIVTLPSPEPLTLDGFLLGYGIFTGAAIVMSIVGFLPLVVYRLYRLIFRRAYSRSTEIWSLGFGVVILGILMY